jgi:TRAP-type C4-dicarboxylate transport system permease small subunit
MLVQARIEVMLVVALVIVVFIYIGLIYLWTVAQPQMNAATPALETLRQTVLGVPHETALAILKWAIILMAFYLITDALVSALRRNPRTKSSRLMRKDSDRKAQ